MISTRRPNRSPGNWSGWRDKYHPVRLFRLIRQFSALSAIRNVWILSTPAKPEPRLMRIAQRPAARARCELHQRDGGGRWRGRGGHRLGAAFGVGLGLGRRARRAGCVRTPLTTMTVVVLHDEPEAVHTPYDRIFRGSADDLGHLLRRARAVDVELAGLLGVGVVPLEGGFHRPPIALM